MAKELPPPSIKMGDYILQFEEGELGPEYEERAKNELRETSEVSQNAIATLKNLLKGKNKFNISLSFFTYF